MAAINNDWLKAMSEEFHKQYYRDLFYFVKDEYSKEVIYPPADDIFNAFHFTPLNKVKVLLLGQDPYHNVNQAHGLSFSVPQTLGGSGCIVAQYRAYRKSTSGQFTSGQRLGTVH